jgi:hypothetical protein
MVAVRSSRRSVADPVGPPRAAIKAMCARRAADRVLEHGEPEADLPGHCGRQARPASAPALCISSRSARRPWLRSPVRLAPRDADQGARRCVRRTRSGMRGTRHNCWRVGPGASCTAKAGRAGPTRGRPGGHRCAKASKSGQRRARWAWRSSSRPGTRSPGTLAVKAL